MIPPQNRVNHQATPVSRARGLQHLRITTSMGTVLPSMLKVKCSAPTLPLTSVRYSLSNRQSGSAQAFMKSTSLPAAPTACRPTLPTQSTQNRRPLICVQSVVKTSTAMLRPNSNPASPSRNKKFFRAKRPVANGPFPSLKMPRRR